MNNPSDNTEADLKKAKTLRMIRTVWMILVPLFAAIILWRLYNYSNGKDNLSGILSPLGLTLIGIASIINERHKMLRTVLIAAAMILVISALVLLFVD